jgi:lipopolysaccharide transport system ATP-binding protein
VGEYIDVPIKRFSSGMQLRLAFAVAAHLAADTMIIDEVLAVGDAEFQRKCLGAMRDVSRKGRTTLFVSHNMSAVESLCSRVVWLDRGEVRAMGAPDHVIHEYLASGYAEADGEAERIDVASRPRGRCAGTARVKAITFVRRPGALERRPWHVAFGEPFELRLECEMDRPTSDAVVGIGVRNDRGEDVLTSHTSDAPSVWWPAGACSGVARLSVGTPWLRPGRYFIEVAVLSGMQLLDHATDVAALIVDEQSAPGAPRLALKKGPVSPTWEWRID